MKKFVKIFTISLLFVIVPFIFVFGSLVVIRKIMARPIGIFFRYSEASSADEVNKARYAKVKSSCVLYRSRDIVDSSPENVWFTIPESYFVTILESDDPLAFKVVYKDKVGFVSSELITEVDFVPKNPTLERITFDIKDDAGTQLRLLPDAESSFKIVIPAATRNISYIASVVGTRPTGGLTNIWYYAIYSPESDPTGVYEGYVYSGKATNLSDIALNEENIEIAAPDEETPPVNDDTAIEINDTVKIVLIVLICLPIILVFVLLIISNHKQKDNIMEDLDEADKPEKKRAKKNSENIEKAEKPKHRAIKNLGQLEGQTLERKPVYYTKFLDGQKEKTHVSSLKPEFPSFEVVDDDDLL